MWYLSSWRDLRRRSNAGHGLGNKPEITPPSHFYHRPDGTRWTSDFDTNAHHRRLFTAAAWRGLEPAPGSGLRRAFLHLSCSLCTIGQFIANLPFLRLRRTLDGPVVPDGVREGRSGQHHGRGVEGGFLASRPGSGRGGADQGAAADAHESRDEGGPFGAAQRAGWVEDLDKTVFLPVAGAVTAVGAGWVEDLDKTVFLPVAGAVTAAVAREGLCRCGEAFEVLLQVRLVLLDLDDEVIARRLGDLECFFDSAWRRS